MMQILCDTFSLNCPFLIVTLFFSNVCLIYYIPVSMHVALTADLNTIHCDKCLGWVHFDCAGLTKSRVDNIPDIAPVIGLMLSLIMHTSYRH
jgi:hypothetical protein